MPPKRTPRGAPILTPWTRFSISTEALIEALQRPAPVKGKRRALTAAAAASYAAHLRWLIPEAADARSLARALVAPTRAGVNAKAAVLRARRSAWARFLAVLPQSAWADAPWPALPAAKPRRPRPVGLSTFRWVDARLLGAGVRWVCLRAQAAGLLVKAPDLRVCSAANIVRRPGAPDTLRISRFLAGAHRGPPEVFLPLADADRLVLAAMLRVTWREDVRQVPREMRLLVSKGAGPLTAGNLAQLRSEAGIAGRDTRYFCPDDAVADVIDSACALAGSSVVLPGIGVDAWGAALIACISTIAISGKGRERALDAGKLLRILTAFQGVERADLRDLASEGLEVTLGMCEDAAVLAAERFAEVNTRTFAAHFELMRERRRQREAGVDVPSLVPAA